MSLRHPVRSPQYEALSVVGVGASVCHYVVLHDQISSEKYKIRLAVRMVTSGVIVKVKMQL